MKKQTAGAAASIDNIYRLDGKVPVAKAIPFGLQHVLAMFVANVAPIILVAQVAVYNGIAFTEIETARLIQNAMLIAGIGTLIQLYPIWRIGSKLPVVMGISFTFVSAMMVYAAQDYGIMIGGIIVGGCIEGVLGLTVKYWRRFVSPIVSACVVTTIGFSLLSVGINSYGASNAYDFGSWQNLLVGTITLVTCLVYQALAKGFWKQLYVLAGLVVGYIAAICFGMVDFAQIGSTVSELGVVSFPQLLHFTPKFELGAIVSITLVFFVSAAETIGDTTAVCNGGLGRDITVRELSGSLACDGFISAVSGGVFGCSPITSFSQNVGLVAMTKVVNRFTIMFGAIIISGVTMLSQCGLDQRNTLIAATSLSIGIGVTLVSGFFDHMPKLIGDIFAGNPVAGVFVVAMVLSLAMPKHVKAESIDALTPESIETPNPSTPEQRLHKEK